MGCIGGARQIAGQRWCGLRSEQSFRSTEDGQALTRSSKPGSP